MTNVFVDAIMKECLAIPEYQVGTVMLKTDFNLKKIGSYLPPFLLLDFMEADDSGQLLGGVTQMGWNIGLNSYAFAPDQLGDDTTGYSPDLLEVIDVARRHFSKGNNGAYIYPTDILYAGKTYMVLDGAIAYNSAVIQPGTSFTAIAGHPAFTTAAGGYLVTGGWLTHGMWDILNKYAFRFSLSSVQPADALEGDGLVMGYRIVFISVSLDFDTANIVTSSAKVTSVSEINNRPY